MADKALLKWVIRQRLDVHMPDEEPEPIVRFDVIHTVEGEGFEKLDSFRVTDDSDSESLANDIHGTAEHDASTRTSGALQRYTVLAFRSDEPGVPHEAAYPFNVRSTMARETFGSDSTPPNEKGITGQLLRHDVDMHRLHMQSQEVLYGRMASQLQTESELRMRAESRIREMLVTEQDLLDKKQERELLYQSQLHQRKFFAELTGLVTSMAPLVISKLMAGKAGVVAPTERSTRDIAVQKFLKGLSQEETMKVIDSLKTPNQISLMELYQSFAESEQKDEAKKPELLRDGQQEEKVDQEARQETRQEKVVEARVEEIPLEKVLQEEVEEGVKKAPRKKAARKKAR